MVLPASHIHPERKSGHKFNQSPAAGNLIHHAYIAKPPKKPKRTEFRVLRAPRVVNTWRRQESGMPQGGQGPWAACSTASPVSGVFGLGREPMDRE